MLLSAQTPACRTYLSLTETTCTACGCSAATPSNSVLSSLPLSTIPCRMVCLGEGGGIGNLGSTFNQTREETTPLPRPTVAVAVTVN